MIDKKAPLIVGGAIGGLNGYIFTPGDLISIAALIAMAHFILRDRA